MLISKFIVDCLVSMHRTLLLTDTKDKLVEIIEICCLKRPFLAMASDHDKMFPYLMIIIDYLVFAQKKMTLQIGADHFYIA